MVLVNAYSSGKGMAMSIGLSEARADIIGVSNDMLKTTKVLKQWDEN